MPPAPPGSGPVPGLPPRIERDEPTAGLPPRIERPPEPHPDPAPPQPELDQEPEPDPQARPELPPRIEQAAVEAAPTPVEPPGAPAEQPPTPAVAVTGSQQPAYRPKHAAPEPAVIEPDVGPPEPPGDERQAPIPPVRPDPLASPVRNALRDHQRLANVLLAVILVVSAGYWVLRVHQRIGEQALEAGITKQQQAPTVACSPLQSNGAAWACAVVFRAESVCLIAKVNVLGSWSTAVGQHRCEKVPRLQDLVPRAITGGMVATDIDRRQSRSDFVCQKLPLHKVRWACERPLATGGQCLVVRVLQWTAWNVIDGGKACAKDPNLQRALKHSSA